MCPVQHGDREEQRALRCQGQLSDRLADWGFARRCRLLGCGDPSLEATFIGRVGPLFLGVQDVIDELADVGHGPLAFQEVRRRQVRAVCQPFDSEELAEPLLLPRAAYALQVGAEVGPQVQIVRLNDNETRVALLDAAEQRGQLSLGLTPELLVRVGKINPHAVFLADEVGVDARPRSLVRFLRVQFVQFASARPRAEHESTRGSRPAGTRRAEEDDGPQFSESGLRLGEAWRWNETLRQPVQLIDRLVERVALLEPLQAGGYDA